MGQERTFYAIKDMKDRIHQIMEAQHMTQQVFARFIEMSPATLSSIFNGRTNPTLNMVEAIKRKIPDINSDWLLFGQGSMYVTSQAADRAQPEAAPAPLRSQEPLLNFEQPVPTTLPPAQGTTENRVSTSVGGNSVKTTHLIPSREEVKYIDKPPRRVTEIRIYYDDQTWESFTPSRK